MHFMSKSIFVKISNRGRKTHWRQIKLNYPRYEGNRAVTANTIQTLKVPLQEINVNGHGEQIYI